VVDSHHRVFALVQRVRDRPGSVLGLVGVVALTFAACAVGPGSGSLTSVSAAQGIHKIQHVVVIQQENRSFDSYFGTYPGAEGLPMANGQPVVCLPDPRTGRVITTV
jgi:phospholipase C